MTTTNADLHNLRSVGTEGLVFVRPAGVIIQPPASVTKIDWAVLFGLKEPSSPNEALFGTTIRRAIHVIRNW